MPRYIDGDKLLARYKERLCAGCKKTKNYCEHCCDIPDVISDIEDAPTADVVEVKYAYDEDGESVPSFTCSACKWFCGDLYEGDEIEGKGWNSYNWCPNCGAKIRRKEDVKTN